MASSRRIAEAAALVLGLFQAATSMAAIAGPVRTDAGLLQGAPATDPSITVFRGIPYAAPPVGALRWRPPQPVAPWQGVRDAGKQAAVCPTGRARAGQTQSEDCLFVNLWTGAGKAGEKRAVMVWFHGSGDNIADPVFDGENLAKKGVVVVTVEYRVGVLAGLATRELSQESGHNASSNYGLMDDVAALQWIKRNISAFSGGDPANVTLFGQSHGAGTQHFLAMSPLAKGLFHRVIMQSHARYPQDPVLFQVALDYKTLPEAEAAGARFMDKLGVHNLKELREVPLEKLLATSTDGGDHVVDGYFVPHNFAETYASGSQLNAFVIAGFNQDETGASPETNYARVAERNAARAAAAAAAEAAGGADRSHQNPTNPSGLAAYVAAAHQKYGAMADDYLKLYPANNDHEAFTANNDATRDNGRVSLWMWAGAWRQKATQPVYLYYWTHAPPGKNHDFTGAYHGSEISFAFNHPRAPDELGWSDADHRIGDVMSSYWTNFAKTGNPNGKGLPSWPAYNGKSQEVMGLGEQFQPLPLADKAKVDFWKRFYATQPAG